MPRVINGDAQEVSLWQYVVGSFVVLIPVSTGEAMLVPEAMTLAVMRWRLANISPGSRWAPVLERYVKYCAARLDGIGGDSSQVLAVPDLDPAAARRQGPRTASRRRARRAVRQGDRGAVRLPRRARRVRVG